MFESIRIKLLDDFSPLLFRPNFNKPNHQGYHKRPPFFPNAKLLVRQIPTELNNISKLNEHFSKFGTIVNLQVSPFVVLSI